MGDFTRELNEILALVSVIDPDEIGTGTSSGDTVDMRMFRRVLFQLAVGDLASGATLDFKLQGSVDGNDPWVDIAGKAITQLTEAGSDDDKQVFVEITAEEANAAGYRYIRGLLTVGTAAGSVCMLALGDVARYEPVHEFSLASLDEIVA